MTSLTSSAELLKTSKDGHEVAAALGISYGKLTWHSYRSPQTTRYVEFKIPKRRGGERTILAPASALKLIQEKLSELLYELYNPREAVYGFVFNKGIKANALKHRGHRMVLNVDLTDFFPSINFGRVRGMFKAKPYLFPDNVATVLAQICCFNNQLPIGAPTSPVVSNMVCARLDSELRRLANATHCTYTRYVDDITFSTNQTTMPMPEEIAYPSGTIGQVLDNIIRSNGFVPNAAKTKLRNQSQRQEITGLIINNRNKVNVRRRFVRQIRAMLNDWKVKGYQAASDKHNQSFAKSKFPGATPSDFRAVIIGKLGFLGYITDKGHPYKNYRNRLSQLPIPTPPSTASSAIPTPPPAATPGTPAAP